MSWGTALSVIGLGLSLYGASQQSSAANDAANANAAAIAQTAAHNAAISRGDAAVAHKGAQEHWFKTNRELSQARQTADNFLAAQRTNYAKSGVAISTGTPTEVFNRTAREFMKDEQIIRYEGLKKIQTAESLADRFENLAAYGLRDAAAQSSIALQTGQDASTAAWIRGGTQISKLAYQWGDDTNWWTDL